MKEEHIDYTEYQDFDDTFEQLARWLEVAYMTGRIHAAQKRKVKMSVDKTQTSSVWVVDDDPTQLKILRIILEAEDYRVTVFDNARQMLNSLKTEKPDVLLLDIMMPDISGLEALKEIRTKYSLSSLPVILITALSMPKDIQEGLSLDANDYIVKPYQRRELAERVRVHTKIRKEREQLEEMVVQSRAIPLGRFLNILQKNLLLILSTTLLCIAACSLYLFLATPRYESSASLIIFFSIPIESIEDLAAFKEQVPGLQDAAVEFLRSETLANLAYDNLASRYDLAVLEGADIEVNLDERSLVADISVRSQNEGLACDLANELVDQAEILSSTGGLFDRFYFLVLKEADSIVNLTVLHAPRTLSYAGLVGLFIGVVLALLLESRQKSATL